MFELTMSAIFLTKLITFSGYIALISLNAIMMFSLYMSYKIKKYDSFWFYTILILTIILIMLQLYIFGIIKITIR
jgi:hypothetical protein|nr:MAG TPA: hypothetical protein [Caudoviricetes sp.]